MAYSHVIETVDTHTGGEATRVVTSSLKIRGRTMAEKTEYFKNNHDRIRRALMFEPRGHENMFGSIITEACDKRADFGVIFMDCGGYLNMCGHGIIGTVTAAIAKGIVRTNKSYTDLLVDTASGLIKVSVKARNGAVESVSFENVASFVYKRGVNVYVNGLNIEVDIVFGGSFFAMLDSKKIGLDIGLSNVEKISRLGFEIKKAANEGINVRYDSLKQIRSIDLVEFYERVGKNHFRNAVVFGNGQIDMSACGTGTCAKLALLYDKKEIGIGGKIINESILGTKFTGEIVRRCESNGIIARITGKAYVTGFNRFIIEREDELKYGFLLNS